MKRNIWVLGCLLTIGFTSVSCNDREDNYNGNEVAIAETQLPENLKTFLATHFPNISVANARKEISPNADGTLYQVKLSNGYQVNFDKNGALTGVIGQGNAIPSSITNLIGAISNIEAYINQHYPNAIITEIEKKSYGYEVEINDDTELKFDAKGNFLGIGDSGGGDSTVIAVTHLPELAKTFLSTHFSGISTTKVEKEKVADSDGTLYEVKLANGFQVDFDANGNWTGVDGNGQQLPSSFVALIPTTITQYLTANYAGYTITEIEKKSYGYEVEINNRIELKFNVQGNIIK